MQKRHIPVLICRLLALFFLGAAIGVITAMLSTPLLWKLEKPTGMELAGHSGPAESIIWLFAAAFGAAFAGFFLLRRRTAIKKERS